MAMNLQTSLFTSCRTNVASVDSVFNDTRKVKVLSLPEKMKEKLMFRAKPLCQELPPLLTLDKGPSLETSIFCVCTANLKSLLKQVWNKILTTVTILMGTSDLLQGCPKKTDTVMVYNTALYCQLFENPFRRGV